MAAVPDRASPTGHEDALWELVGPAMRGDARAITELMNGVGPKLLRVVRQVLGSADADVEDVVQEAAFALMEALPRFRHDCTVSHFAARVALLTAMNARRRARIRERLTPRHPGENIDELGTDDRTPSTALLGHTRRLAVAQLLGDLPVPQAEALAMHCILGYTISETAAATGVPGNTVRSRLLAAKAALRKRIADDPELQEQLDLAKGAG